MRIYPLVIMGIAAFCNVLGAVFEDSVSGRVINAICATLEVVACYCIWSL